MIPQSAAGLPLPRPEPRPAVLDALPGTPGRSRRPARTMARRGAQSPGGFAAGGGVASAGAVAAGADSAGAGDGTAASAGALPGCALAPVPVASA
ncbi:MAG: hypothetical protein ACK52I_18675, partial [Pseudomonadota bacterium]